MTRSYRKNTLRTFKSTASRFAAVFAIVALGVGFLAGLNATPIDMKESMERYMDDGNFYDLRIVSTLGLTDEDVDALRQVEGVRQVQPGYSADLLVEVDGDTVVSRVHSLPAPENNTINQLNLVEGRLPEKSGECVVEASYTKKAIYLHRGCQAGGGQSQRRSGHQAEHHRVHRRGYRAQRQLFQL